MRRWLHQSGTIPPPLEVYPTIADDEVIVAISTADNIYQEQPWVAARKYTGECVRLDTAKIGLGLWQFSYSRQEFDHVAVGVSDIHGNDAIVDVDDGSRRWAVQSEFAAARPFQMDFDTSPTCAMLAKTGGVYLTSGTLTFEHDAGPAVVWKTINLAGSAPIGANLRCRYKTADTPQLLDTATWSMYQTGSVIVLPPDSREPCLRVEVLLEGTPTVTPELNSLEVIYETPTAGIGRGLWKLY
jgi:hypothetical protein